MANYKTMYHTLFNKVEDVIAELQAVQQQTEEMYISCDGQNNGLSLNEKQDSVSTIAQK